MCRLFGLHAGREPVRASFWLLDAPGALLAQSRRNPDGFGIGTFEPDGSPDLDKAPTPAYDTSLYATEARDERSRTYVAHVRYASVGALTYENTHPFEQDGRLFAHNGVVGFDPEAPVDRSLVHGDTDSERLFALVTLAIREHGGDVAAGIRAAARRVAEEVELYSMNFVLTTPDELWALRYPEHNELLVLERSCAAELEQRSDHGVHVRSHDAAGRRVVVVASERMDDGDGWDSVAPGELVHVGADLRVTREV
ncbi:MAG: class II glutamine amidotransferase, partial [Actinomycetota bacterium]|nr:class II glutamine amidotransferase [Actinomycetota bacterium]